MNRCSLVCFLVLITVAAACRPSNEPKTIAESRTVPSTATNPPAAAPSQVPGTGMQGMTMPGMAGMPSTPTGHYTWTAPEGWETLPATPMRKANFKIDADSECYLSVFSGQAGGIQMNVERWRAQMGLGETPMSPEEIAALPKVSMAGREGVLAEFTGTYVSMKGESKPNQTLLGVITEMGNEVVFVKMVGPEATIKANRDKFLAFCTSIQGTSPTPATPPDSTPPSQTTTAPAPSPNPTPTTQTTTTAQ